MSNFERARERLERARLAFSLSQGELIEAEREYREAEREWQRTGPFRRLFHLDDALSDVKSF